MGIIITDLFIFNLQMIDTLKYRCLIIDTNEHVSGVATTVDPIVQQQQGEVFLFLLLATAQMLLDGF